MSLSRKLYFPKSLSFGAIRWSFLALASFIKRNSLRSIHSFSSCSPCASLHNSSSVHVPLRNLLGHKVKCQPSKTTGIRLVTRDMQSVSVINFLTRQSSWQVNEKKNHLPNITDQNLCLFGYVMYIFKNAVVKAMENYHRGPEAQDFRNLLVIYSISKICKEMHGILLRF